MEHVARLHGCAVPDWGIGPVHLHYTPHVMLTNRAVASDSVFCAARGFIRQSVFPDPSDCGVRGGEKHAWTPQIRSRPSAAERSRGPSSVWKRISRIEVG